MLLTIPNLLNPAQLEKIEQTLEGASFVDVATRLAAAADRVLPNVSRAVLANGGTQADIRSAIRALVDDCDRALGRPRP